MVQLRGVHVNASRSDHQLDFLYRVFVKDDVQILPMLITLNEMKDQILKATARSEQSLLKSVGHKVKYCLDVCGS
jgi:hypothetical protein